MLQVKIGKLTDGRPVTELWEILPDMRDSYTFTLRFVGGLLTHIVDKNFLMRNDFKIPFHPLEKTNA